MTDKNKTKEQLITELAQMRQRVSTLETQEVERKQAEAERERLLAAEREQRTLTEALHWAGAVLSSTLNYEKVLDHAMEQIGRVVPYNAACIMLLEGKTVRVFRWRGYENFKTGSSIAATPFNIDDVPPLRTVRETGWPLVVPFVADNNEWVGISGQGWVKSSITVPVRTRNRLVGFLQADSDSPGAYAQSDGERLHAFANQAAIALENARHYDHARQEIAKRVKALKKERNFVSTILNTVGALVVVLDAQGKILSFNRACEQTTGYTLDEVSGKHVWDLFLPPEQVEPIKTMYAQLKRGHYPVEHEDSWLTKNGDTRLISWFSTVLFDSSGDSVDYVICSGTDITERRQSEKEREKLIEELEAFGYTVAHDLQEPLSGVVGFADALKRYHRTMSTEEFQEALQIIARNSLKMSNIIDELMLLAGVRKQDVSLKPLDMAGIITEAQRRLAYLIDEKQARFTLPPAWPEALGHAPWVEEVWVNYLSNAIKYGGDPPHLKLGSLVQDDGLVSFWVCDNGPGLSPEEQAHLFTPFTRLNQVRAKGHGLGLSIVKRIVEKLGGQVSVDSEGVPGKGATFGFTLPAAAAPGD